MSAEQNGAPIRFSSEMLRESYTRIRHRSGLTVCVFPKKMTNTYAVIATRYGSVDNKFRLDGESKATRVPDGVAHFLEHKLFDNPDGTDSIVTLSALGADANAYTDYDKTAFLFGCTGNFDDSLAELLRFVTHPHFTAQSVKKEQGIIAEEIRMYEDDPWERSYQNLLLALYRENPVHNNICGSRESIAKITAPMLYRCYRAFYNLSNMVLAVCGDVSVEQVLAVADRILPDHAEPCTVLRVPPKAETRVAKARIDARMQTAKPIFQIGILDPTLPSDPEERLARDARMELLGEILFSRSGAFYNDLFESGVITPSFSESYSSSPTFAFHMISGESDDPETVFDRVRAYLRKTAETGLDTEEFERAKRVMYSDEIRAYDSTEEIANRLLAFELDGGGLLSYPERIAGIRKEELNELLRTSFRDEYFALSVVRPKETEDPTHQKRKELKK